ncbi:hypothetical protein SLEP1_g39837 [Rubroshorea leprosula]|uniref:Uncharacterized protein n=1 Tax=Rubroshorea leprosula TaxID=152421 RepID=A0AAV5L1U8_9ROSI|nr:hypothetical protein SLEP1_g39837 [Rubroshorea leprosula]
MAERIHCAANAPLRCKPQIEDTLFSTLANLNSYLLKLCDSVKFTSSPLITLV